MIFCHFEPGDMTRYYVIYAPLLPKQAVGTGGSVCLFGFGAGGEIPMRVNTFRLLTPHEIARLLRYSMQLHTTDFHTLSAACHVACYLHGAEVDDVTAIKSPEEMGWRTNSDDPLNWQAQLREAMHTFRGIRGK